MNTCGATETRSGVHTRRTIFFRSIAQDLAIGGTSVNGGADTGRLNAGNEQEGRDDAERHADTRC